MEVIEVVKNNLGEMNEDYDIQKPNIQNYLISIEEYVINLNEKKENAVNVLKSNSLTVKAVAQLLKKSRTVIYNHPILMKYIDNASKRVAHGNPFREIEELKKYNSLLQDRIDKMEIRDINIEAIKMENKILKSKLRETKKELKQYQEKTVKMEYETRRLKKELKKT